MELQICAIESSARSWRDIGTQSTMTNSLSECWSKTFSSHEIFRCFKLFEIGPDVKLIWRGGNELSSPSYELEGSLSSESSYQSKGLGRMCLAAKGGPCDCAEGKWFICAKLGWCGVACSLTGPFVSNCCNGGGGKPSTDCSIGCNESKLGWSRREALPADQRGNGWTTFLNDRSTPWNLEFLGCCVRVGREGKLGQTTAWEESKTSNTPSVTLVNHRYHTV